MHPILHLAPQREPEYRRGLAHGLTLAMEQLHRLAGGQPLLTASSLRALTHRLQALKETIQHGSWKEANQLVRHETAPPIPADERPIHQPVLGRAAEERTFDDRPYQLTPPHRHIVRR